jgi:hypothetical protein
MEEHILDADEISGRIGRLDNVTEPKVLAEAQKRWEDEEDARRILDDDRIDAFQTVDDDDDYDLENEDEVEQPEEVGDKNPPIDLPRVIPSEQPVGPVYKEPAVLPTIVPVPTPVAGPDDAQVTVRKMKRLMRQFAQHHQTPQIPPGVDRVETPPIDAKRGADWVNRTVQPDVIPHATTMTETAATTRVKVEEQQGNSCSAAAQDAGPQDADAHSREDRSPRPHRRRRSNRDRSKDRRERHRRHRQSSRGSDSDDDSDGSDPDDKARRRDRERKRRDREPNEPGEPSGGNPGGPPNRPPGGSPGWPPGGPPDRTPNGNPGGPPNRPPGDSLVGQENRAPIELASQARLAQTDVEQSST